MSRRYRRYPVPRKPTPEDIRDAFIQPPTAANERYFNDDLAALSDEELREERARLRLGRLLPGHNPREWWQQERLSALEREMEGRRRGH